MTIKTDFKDEDIDNAEVIGSDKVKPYISLDIKGNTEIVNLEYNELTAMLSMLYRKTNELKKEAK
jgi:hypothetical protein